jgi:uncharacterized membrane protein
MMSLMGLVSVVRMAEDVFVNLPTTYISAEMKPTGRHRVCVVNSVNRFFGGEKNEVALRPETSAAVAAIRCPLSSSLLAAD